MTYTRTVHLPVSPEEAFALITEPERLRRWQTVTATIDLRAGGDFRWLVTPGHLAGGTIKEVEPGKRLLFGWGWDGSPELPYDASSVTITLEAAGAGTALTITHEGLTEAQEASHAEGWAHYLSRLELLAATGYAGPDAWAWAPENLTPVVAAEACLAALQPVLRGLTDADKSAQTPCADFTCHQLAEHLFGTLATVGAMAGATVTNPETGSLENRVSVMAGQMIDAWRTYDGATVVGGDLPSGVAQAIMAVELLLHGWDFAQASGQEMRVSDEVATYVTELVTPVIDGNREGSFAPAKQPVPGASALDRLAAFSGRTPLAR